MSSTQSGRVAASASETFPSLPVPTRVRYRVLAYASALSMITYLDRVCFGAAAPSLALDLGLQSVAGLKWAFTSFAIAYAIFEVPSGWLGDAWGPRSALIRIVLWWSACTALTAVVGLQIGQRVMAGLGTLIVLRFLFGAGEAGAYPNITRALHNWFPSTKFATAQGCVWMSGRLMGGLTPLVWFGLTAGLGLNWRIAFLIFGLLGLAWCAGFAASFRNRPAEHPRVNAAESALIGGLEISSAHEGVPWRTFLTSGNLWLLCVMYFCMAYGWYFNITYLPAYVSERFEISDASALSALCKGSPLLIGALGCGIGGLLVDGLERRLGDRRRARRLVGIVTQSLSGVFWLTALGASQVGWFYFAVSAAALANDLSLASAWATCQDIGRRYAAVTAACMNTIGTLGAALAGWLTGTLIDWSLARSASDWGLPAEALASVARKEAIDRGFELAFMTYAAVYFVSAVCWRFIDPDRAIVPETEAPAA